jgi:hypothetical protein
MFKYSAYALRISSAIELAELMPAAEGGDVTIRLARAPGWLTQFKTAAQRVEVLPNLARFWFQDVGAFEVRDGRDIDVVPEPGVDASLLRLYVQGMVLAMLLHQRGFCVLHASVVRIGDSAVAFCGPVGSGKSTLAAALVGKGCELLSDDNAAISLAGRRPLVASAYPFVKLFPEIAESLGFAKKDLRTLHQLQSKVAGRVSQRFRSSTTPLRAIFVLGRSVPDGIGTLPESQAAIEIVRNSVPVRWGHPAGEAHFRDCVKLARQVPVCSLRTFDTISGIDAVVNSVLSHCGKQPALETALRTRFAGELQPQF